jgi:hypothetical protein
MQNAPESGGNKPREVPVEGADGVEPRLLKEKAEAVLSRLGYQSTDSSSGRLPSGYRPPEDGAATPLVRPRPEESSHRESVDSLRAEVKALEQKQLKTPLNFAECMMERHLGHISSTTMLAAAREGGEGRRAPEFDENLLRVLRDFDEETIYDFIITVRKYAAYAEKVPASIRDAKMRQWEWNAFRNLERIERIGVLYQGIINLRMWTEKPADSSARENVAKNLPSCARDIVELMGDPKNSEPVVKIQVWNPDRSPGAPATINKSITIDRSLFTDPKRKEDLDLLEDACRQLMRSMAGGGVGYDLQQPSGVRKELDAALEAKNLREGIAKLLATIIVGTPPKKYEGAQSPIRLPHAMLGKLLNGHVGQLETQGTPKFDPEKDKRDPVEFQKLADMRNGIRLLAREQDENVHYTMSLLMHQTMKLMSPLAEPGLYVKDQKKFNAVSAGAVSQGALDRTPLPPQAREGIAEDQVEANLTALGNVIDVTQNGLLRQAALVEGAERSVEDFMNSRLVKYIEFLSNWKGTVMNVTQWAPIYAELSLLFPKMFPGIRGRTDVPELIAKLKAEVDKLQERNKKSKEGLATARNALQKAAQELKEEHEELLALQEQRKQLARQLFAATNEEQRKDFFARLKENEGKVDAMKERVDRITLDFCDALAELTKINLSILEEAAMSDNFFTARDEVGWKALLVSSYLFVDWLSSYRITRGIISKTAGLIPGVKNPLTNAIAARAWQVQRIVGLAPEEIPSMVRGVSNVIGDKLLVGARSAGTVDLATGTASTGQRLARAAELGVTTAKYKNLGIAIEEVHNLKLAELRAAYQRVAAAGGNAAEAKRIFRAEVVPILREKISALKATHGLSHSDASLLVRRGVCGATAAEMDFLGRGVPGWNIYAETAAELAQEASPVARTGVVAAGEIGATGRTIGATADGERAVAASAADAANTTRLGKVLESFPGAKKVLDTIPLHPKLAQLLEESPEAASLFARHLQASRNAGRIVAELNAAAKTTEDISFIGRVMSTERGIAGVVAGIEAGKPVSQALAQAAKVSRIGQVLRVTGRAVPVVVDSFLIYTTVLEMQETSAELATLRGKGASADLIRSIEQKYYFQGAQLAVSGVGAVAGGCLLFGVGASVAAPVMLATLPISAVLAGAYASHQVSIDESRTVGDWRNVPLAERLAALRTYSFTERFGHTTREFVAGIADAEMALGGNQQEGHSSLDEMENNVRRKRETDEKKIRSVIEDTTTVAVPSLVMDPDGKTRPPNEAEVAQYQSEIKQYVDARVQFFLDHRVDSTHLIREGDIVDLLENSEYAGQFAKEKPNLQKELDDLSKQTDAFSQKRATDIRAILQEKDPVEQVKKFKKFTRSEQMEGLYVNLSMRAAALQKEQRGEFRPVIEREVARVFYERSQPALMNFNMRCEEDNFKSWWPDGFAPAITKVYAQEKVEEMVLSHATPVVEAILGQAETPDIRGPVAFEAKAAELQLDVERFLANPVTVWQGIPQEKKDFKLLPEQGRHSPEHRETIQKGEALMKRVDANYNGTYYTKQYGLPLNKYLYMKFDAEQGKWMVNLGNAQSWHDPSTYRTDMWGGTAKFDQLIQDLHSINEGRDPSQ